MSKKRKRDFDYSILQEQTRLFKKQKTHHYIQEKETQGLSKEFLSKLKQEIKQEVKQEIIQELLNNNQIYIHKPFTGDCSYIS